MSCCCKILCTYCLITPWHLQVLPERCIKFRKCYVQAAEKDLPSLEADIAAGEFSGLKLWLNEKIHKIGSLHPSGDDLMRAATGSPLDPSIFLKYLTDKYTALYKL